MIGVYESAKSNRLSKRAKILPTMQYEKEIVENIE